MKLLEKTFNNKSEEKKDKIIYLKNYQIPISVTNQFDSCSELTKEEKIFLNFLYSYLLENNFTPNIKYKILSNNTIDVRYNEFQIGRVKLRGRKFKMQLLTTNNVKWIEGTLEDFINKIPDWLKYIKTLK